MKQALQAVSYKIGEQLFCDLRLLELMMAYAGKGNEGFPNLQFKRIITCIYKSGLPGKGVRSHSHALVHAS